VQKQAKQERKRERETHIERGKNKKKEKQTKNKKRMRMRKKKWREAAVVQLIGFTKQSKLSGREEALGNGRPNRSPLCHHITSMATNGHFLLPPSLAGSNYQQYFDRTH